MVKTVREGKPTHFLGSIVSVDNVMGGTSEYLVIDGQQRITTVSLLMLAMVNLTKEGKYLPEEKEMIERIEKKYLIDEFENNRQKLKLKPIKSDQEAYELLWGNHEDYIYSSSVTTNYLYFYYRLQKGELSLEELFQAIAKLQIIDISLNSKTDDSQLIFESLNSTGLELNEGDKIRNYILMGLSIHLQESYYTKYWNRIEKLARRQQQIYSYDVSNFIRDYLSIKQRSIPAMKQIYFCFKEYAENYKKKNIESLFIDLMAYARRYHKLFSGDKAYHWKLNASIYRMNRLESTVTKPFLMEIIRKQEEGILSAQETSEIFLIVETYVFRRFICDLPSNMLNKVFLNLDYEVKKIDNTVDNYLEKLKYILINKKEKSRFPEDEEFLEKLCQRNIYAMSSKYKAYLFDRLENEDNLEYKSIYSHLDKGDYSIEHIMPQTLNAAWKESLGTNWEEIHKDWLNRLANLTLTAYNSEYRNFPFKEKRDRKKGFADSGLKINQRIAKKDNWGEEELKERSIYLAQKSLELWPYIKTKYVPLRKQLDVFTFADEIQYTGRTIVKFQFHDVEQKVSGWTELYHKVLEELHRRDKSILNKIADMEKSSGIALQVTREKKEMAQYYKIDENLYIAANTGTQHKINLLLKFLTLFGEDPSELIVYTKDNQSGLRK